MFNSSVVLFEIYFSIIPLHFHKSFLDILPNLDLIENCTNNLFVFHAESHMRLLIVSEVLPAQPARNCLVAFTVDFANLDTRLKHFAFFPKLAVTETISPFLLNNCCVFFAKDIACFFHSVKNCAKFSPYAKVLYNKCVTLCFSCRFSTLSN